MSKYHAKRTEVDGITFASKAEARRYQELKLLEQGGVISDLVLQPKYVLIVNGTKVGDYVADFHYWDNERNCGVVEDVKGGDATKTPVYRLKKRIFEAQYGHPITEVQA